MLGFPWLALLSPACYENELPQLMDSSFILFFFKSNKNEPNLIVGFFKELLAEIFKSWHKFVK